MIYPLLLNIQWGLLNPHRHKFILVLSSSSFWESLTLALTLAGAFVSTVGVFLKSPLKIARWFSNIGTLLTFCAALALGRYTYLNRIDQRNLEQTIKQEARNARLALNKAGSAESKLTREEQTNENNLRDQKTAEGLLERKISDSSLKINEIQSKVGASQEEASIQELISRMDADDATSFDKLRSIRHFGSQAEKFLVRSAIENVIAVHNSFGYIGTAQAFYKYVPSSREVRAMLLVPDSSTRKSALKAMESYGYAQYPDLPILVEIAVSDPSLDARTLATQIINNVTEDHFTALKPEDIHAWWHSKGGGREQLLQFRAIHQKTMRQ
jgi:hypothetical protein